MAKYNFKCLVKLNGNRYSVTVEDIDKHIHKIPFSKVLKKIQQIDEKLDIDFNHYLFEVLDNDFDNYVVITDGNQLIDDLSRIRITRRRSSSTVSAGRSPVKILRSPVKGQSVAEVAIPSPKKISEPLIGDKRLHSSPIGSKSVDKSIDDLNVNIIKALDIPVLSRADIAEFKDLMLLLEIHWTFFETNPNNSGNWTRISHRMKSKCYSGERYLPKNLKQLFYKYLGIYEQVLEYSKDTMAAKKYFPLFECIHSIDLKPYISEQSLNRLKLLREKFALKERNASQCLVISQHSTSGSPKKTTTSSTGFSSKTKSDSKNSKNEVKSDSKNSKNDVKCDLKDYKKETKCNSKPFVIPMKPQVKSDLKVDTKETKEWKPKREIQPKTESKANTKEFPPKTPFPVQSKPPFKSPPKPYSHISDKFLQAFPPFFPPKPPNQTTQNYKKNYNEFKHRNQGKDNRSTGGKNTQNQSSSSLRVNTPPKEAPTFIPLVVAPSLTTSASTPSPSALTTSNKRSTISPSQPYKKSKTNVIPVIQLD